MRRTLAAAALADDEYSGEYHYCGQEFLPGQDIQYKDDADDCSNDRLDITVHADKGRAYAFLSVWNQKIGKKSSEYYKISQFPHLCRRYLCP